MNGTRHLVQKCKRWGHKVEACDPAMANKRFQQKHTQPESVDVQAAIDTVAEPVAPSQGTPRSMLMGFRRWQVKSRMKTKHYGC